MRIEKNYALKSHNSLAVESYAAEVYFPSTLEELKQLISDLKSPLILGSGTNVLFATDKISRPIVIPQMMGIEKIHQNKRFHVVSGGAGVEWQDLVDFCVNNALGGIENLSLIPGKVGAAPVQNIGAYGVELKDVFYALEALEIETGKVWTFNHEMCGFGYRDSIFKKAYKDRFIITKVFLKLPVDYHVNAEYGGLKMRLNTMGITDPGIREMRDCVNATRRSKLPYPDEMPNAGSFFKNPIVTRDKLESLQKEASYIPHYDMGDQTVKIPAAWLIEQSGLKAFKMGRASVSEKHALVLVNHDNASGAELLQLANHIIDTVHEKYEIRLAPEVNILTA